MHCAESDPPRVTISLSDSLFRSPLTVSISEVDCLLLGLPRLFLCSYDGTGRAQAYRLAGRNHQQIYLQLINDKLIAG